MSIEVTVLEETDIIKPTDLVRSCFATREWDDRATKWSEARIAIPAWVGKTLRDYYNFSVASRGDREQIMRVPPELRDRLGFIVTSRKEISLFP